MTRQCVTDQTEEEVDARKGKERWTFSFLLRLFLLASASFFFLGSCSRCSVALSLSFFSQKDTQKEQGPLVTCFRCSCSFAFAFDLSLPSPIPPPSLVVVNCVICGWKYRNNSQDKEKPNINVRDERKGKPHRQPPFISFDEKKIPPQNPLYTHACNAAITKKKGGNSDTPPPPTHPSLSTTTHHHHGPHLTPPSFTWRAARGGAPTAGRTSACPTRASRPRASPRGSRSCRTPPGTAPGRRSPWCRTSCRAWASWTTRSHGTACSASCPGPARGCRRP